MNADDFVLMASLYGYSVIKRISREDSYAVLAFSPDEDVLLWEGPSRAERGEYSDILDILIRETVKVDKVMNEIRSN